MATFVVGGVEKIEYAQSSLAGVVTTWKQLENIAPDSVVFTKNAGTKTSVIPEDKNVAFLNFFTPGDGDTLAIGVLEQKPEVMQDLFNVAYTPATSLMVFNAQEKIANLAFRITCRPLKDGRKAVITIYNTDVVTTYVNNLTKTAAQQILLTATLGAYRATGMTEDAVYTKQFVLADGSAIDSSVA